MNIACVVTILRRLDSVPSNDESAPDDWICLNKIVEYYMAYASAFVSFAVIQSASEFKNSYSSLLTTLQEFLNNCLTNNDKDAPLSLLGVMDAILVLICNLTNSIRLIPIFLDIGYVEKTIRWIRTDLFESHISILGNSIISIIHNLSRDQAGLKQLLKEKAFDALMERKLLVHREHDEDLTQVFGMILITVATSDEQSEENKKLILDTSESFYKLCMKAGRDNELGCDTYHLSEILELLHRAFTNTYVMKHTLDNGINEQPTRIQSFAELFLSIYGALLDPEPDDLEKRAAKYLLKILIQISSYPEYSKELKDNNQFSVIIQSLTNRPKQNEAKRIWCNLQQRMPSYESTKEKTSMIYVSYHRADEEFCKEFVQKLREKIAIQISVEYENVELHDDTWEYSSQMIESATVILVVVSTAYGESTDKFQELSQIISTNKSRDEQNYLIVVKAEPNFNFNRQWMQEWLQEKTSISYDTNIDNMVRNACEQIEVPKKSLTKCLPCWGKNERAQTTKSGYFVANSEKRVCKRLPTASSSLPPTKAFIPKKSPNTTDSSSVYIAGKKHESYSVVSGLVTQTGSAGGSSWV